MLWFKLFFVLLLSEAYGQQQNKFFRKDYNFIDTTDSFYKIHTVTKSWRDAKRICGLEGASFFYPEDQTEADAVLQFLSATQKSMRWVYIGVSDVLAREVFEATDGTPIGDIYNNWAPGWPTGKHPQNCVSIHSSDGLLREDNCVDKLQFVCKKKLQDVQWNEHCNMPNIDYKYNSTLGKCYKFHLNPLNWTDAYYACSAERSYLAVINSQAEADHLAHMTEHAPKDNIGGDYLRGVVHLGFHNRDNEGWATIKGTSLVDCGYSVWGGGQPDNAGGNEVCGSMFYDGQLNDIGCQQRMFFICEHDINTMAESMDYRFSNNVFL